MNAPKLSVVVFATNPDGDLLLVNSGKVRGWGPINETAKPKDGSLLELAKRAVFEESGELIPFGLTRLQNSSPSFGIITGLHLNRAKGKALITVAARIIEHCPVRIMKAVKAIGYFSTKPTTSGKTWDSVVTHPLDIERMETHFLSVAEAAPRFVEFEYKAANDKCPGTPYRKLSERLLTPTDFTTIGLPLAALGSLFPSNTAVAFEED